MIELKERLQKEAIAIGFIGDIGSGKSTLSKALSESLGTLRIEENFPANPFLKDFYDSPAEYSFRSQCWFLKSTVDQLISEKPNTVSKSSTLDPANAMNRIFAKTHLNLGWMKPEEFDLYEDLYSTLETESAIKKPDVIVWTDAGNDVLAERIVKRGRPFELRILKDFPYYLSAIRDTIKSEVLAGNLQNVVYVNTFRNNFADEHHIERLTELIGKNLNI